MSNGDTQKLSSEDVLAIRDKGNLLMRQGDFWALCDLVVSLTSLKTHQTTRLVDDLLKSLAAFITLDQAQILNFSELKQLTALATLLAGSPHLEAYQNACRRIEFIVAHSAPMDDAPFFQLGPRHRDHDMVDLSEE